MFDFLQMEAIPWNVILLAIVIVSSVIFAFRSIWFSRRLRALKNELTMAQRDLAQALEQHQLTRTELSALKTHFDHYVMHDPVTRLPGRKLYEDRLLQALNQAKRYQLVFGVLSLEIDEFKIIGSVLGNDAADILLQEVASRLQMCIRQVDTLSRSSDDGFVLLLPQITKAETAAYVAQRVLDILTEPFNIAQQKLFITASIGISIYPVDGEDGVGLINNANVALQQAKSSGHNAYQFYHKELSALSYRELTLNSSLRSDLIYQEFVLYYQPQVNVETKEIHCMEALLRWQHPELGLVAPNDFLRLAENTGRIVEIGEWVLRTACQQLKTWQSLGLNLKRVAINVSMRQLENPHFSYKISQILQETELEPSRLVLEISERILSPRLTFIEKTLHIISQLGVQIAIDDFGTGNLSLAHLRKCSVNYLKIDNSLIRHIETDKESEAIIKMMIGLANSLQLVTVAEGVEQDEEKNCLKEMGCFLMQGHLFSVPLLPQEFTESLVRQISEHE